MTVVVVGDVVNDVVVRARGPVQVGSDTESDIRRTQGGSGANQAAWLATLGVPVRFYGRVGESDAHAHATALRAVGVDAHLAVDPLHETGNIVALVAPDGERSMFTDRGANHHLDARDLPEDLRGVTHLHVSGYSLFDEPARAGVVDLMERARQRSVPVSCDPSSESGLVTMGVDQFLSCTRGVTTIFPNAPEALLLAGDRARQRETSQATREEEAARALTHHYPTVVVKLGAQGALAAVQGGDVVRVRAPNGRVVDTTGAGDAFCAGYLAALVGGASVEHALDQGVQTAARAIGHLGARPVHPNRNAQRAAR